MVGQSGTVVEITPYRISRAGIDGFRKNRAGNYEGDEYIMEDVMNRKPEYGMGARSNGIEERLSRKVNEHQQGVAGQHGEMPGGGQGHFGQSARISDQGSDGRKQRGATKQELGSHGGARRSHENPGKKGSSGRIE
jgi:hypothetical protein